MLKFAFDGVQESNVEKGENAGYICFQKGFILRVVEPFSSLAIF